MPSSRPWSPEDVLDIPTAIARLDLPPAEGRRWLHAHHLALRIAGHERVIWGDVTAALRPPEAPDRPWSGDDLLTITETLDRLRMNHSAARAWLHKQDLIHRVGHARRVIWRDVLRAARGDDERTHPSELRPRIRRPLPLSNRI